MRNLWIQQDAPYVTWLADLTSVGDDGRRSFVASVLESGANHSVVEVERAPTIDFDASRDGPLTAAHLDPVDLFAFTGAAMAPGAPRSSTVRAWLSWYDLTDTPTGGWVRDPGALLRSLEPVPGCIPEGFMDGWPPVRITSHRGQVRIALHSDIWLPWVFGSAHPEADHLRMFDNLELARLHTPRLNAFLGDVRKAVSEIGGSWDIDVDGTGDVAAEQLDDEGIDLSFRPRSVMPARALDAEWF